MSPNRERIVLALIALVMLAFIAGVTGWVVRSLVMCR